MTIIAGIDEAGLGPYLGPLVVSCSAMRVPDDWKAHSPWEQLTQSVVKKPSKKDSRFAVGDSKKVYTSLGRDGLEKTVLAFLANNESSGVKGESLSRNKFIESLGDNKCLEELEKYPWYSGTDWSLPAQDGNSEKLLETLQSANCSLQMMKTDVVLAGLFNDRVNRGLNKNELLLQSTGAHLKAISEAFPNESVAVTADKQGGRNFYHSFLLEIFPDNWIDIVEEGAKQSIYRVRRDGVPLWVRFAPKADDNAFCVALASIICKYIRERFMEDLNGWFIERVPDLKPTAGYPGDAPRFIEQTKDVLLCSGASEHIFGRLR